MRRLIVEPERRGNKFRGAGGMMGGHTSSPKPPTEDPDSLRSTQFAHVIDLLSEGPITGLVGSNYAYFVGAQNPANAVWFNQTALASDANSAQMNFNGVGMNQCVGVNIQTGLNFPGVEDTVNAGLSLKHNIPFTFTIEDPDTSRVVIAIRVPQLWWEDDKGNIHFYSVTHNFGISLNDGGFMQYGNHTITGKCTSDFVREYYMDLPKSATPWKDHWAIQIVRQSNDDSDAKHQSASVFDYYTRVINHNFMYPYCAAVHIQLDASQLSDIPVRGYRIKGLYVPVPSNYFPDKRTYSRNRSNGAETYVYQPWDGTFYLAWSNNPAWVFYDMCTNYRYGAGEFLGQNVDKWTLYQIAQYCDQQVPDGYGGWEPRFTCNVYIQAQQQAWKVLSDLASVFRGMLYWGQGMVVPVQDAPKPIMHSFTNANVIDAKFTYTDTELKNRNSDAAVTWNDPDDFFNNKIQSSFDVDQRIKYGFRETKFTSFGCTSRGQARRHGTYVLATNKYEVETVTFQTGFEAMYLRPGDVIGIVDNDRIGLRQGGRIKSVNGHNVTLDKALDAFPDAQEIYFYNAQNVFTIGDAFTDSNQAKAQHPSMMWKGYIYRMNGMAQQTVYVQDINGNAPPQGSTTGGLQKGTIFVIGANYYTPLDVPQDTFRIITIIEKEKNTFEITAVQYVQGKYDLIDFGIQFQLPLLTRIPAITFVLPPNNLTARLHVVVVNKVVHVYIILTWEQPPEKNLRSYRVKAKPPDTGWVEQTETSSTTFTYPAPMAGLYSFQVVSVNHADICSQPAQVSITVPDLSLIRPHRISGLELQSFGNNMVYQNSMPVISWRLNSPTNSFPFNSEEPYGANVGNYDPYFMSFQVTVSDANTDQVGWIDNTYDLQYAITYDQNKLAWGDGLPRHKLKVQVVALNSLGLDDPPETLIIDNPAPDPPVALSAIVGGGPTPQRVTLTWTNPVPSPNKLDFEQTYVYRNTTNDFATATKVDSVSGNSNQWHSSPLATGTYWFFIAAVDSFFSLSTPVSVQVTMP
jgi:predicted phage tail protein